MTIKPGISIQLFSNSSDVRINGSTIIVQSVSKNRSADHPNARGWKRLLKKASTAALYDTFERFDRPKCHPNTRVSAIESLTKWATSEIDRPMMWLNGPAGAGKSATAHTLAENCDAQGFLLAAFIFRRSISSCNTCASFVSTLACQVGVAIPETRHLLDGIVDSKPMILDQSLDTQFRQLIINPLLQLIRSGVDLSTKPYLIIIDGLDECNDKLAQNKVVKLLTDVANHPLLFLRILITSRPVANLHTAFATPSTNSVLSRITLEDGYQTYQDIRRYLADSLAYVKATHPGTTSITLSTIRLNEIRALKPSRIDKLINFRQPLPLISYMTFWLLSCFQQMLLIWWRLITFSSKILGKHGCVSALSRLSSTCHSGVNSRI